MTQTWLTVRDAATLLGYQSPSPLRRDLRLYPNKYQAKVAEDSSREYRIALESLPPEAQAKYAGTPAADIDERRADLPAYHQAPEYNRRKANKYMAVLQASAGLKGAALEKFIAEWNVRYPEMRTSYKSLLRERAAVEKQGLAALIGKHGHMAGYSSVRDEAWMEFFLSIYLKEGGAPLTACWEMTLGFAREKDPSITPETFPSHKAFERLLRKRVPESAIYRAREGYSRWYRKFAMGIARNYDDTLPNDLWVSDHRQLDVMVTLPNGRTCRPWGTWWMDVKTGKVVGFNIHEEAPNSDHIFQAFYDAVLAFGLPREVYIDNGKDYRARDLSGGRSSHTLRVDEPHALSLFSVLDIIVHFALPYNAQSKIIERRFLEMKTRFDRMLTGFCGGNVVEKPEALADEIRLGRLLTYDRLGPLLEQFVTQVYNQRKSNGIALKGQSPDQHYAAYAPAPRTITPDALMLFCTRICTGHGGMGIKVGRDGVKDSEMGVTYWAEWMQAIKGTRVYLRRDPKKYQTAWVFNADTHAYLGQAALYASVAMIAQGDVQKADLRERMAQKRREDKLTKSYLPAHADTPSAEDRMRYLANGVQAISESRPIAAAPMATAVEITEMDKVLAEQRRQEATGTADMARARPAAPPSKPKIFRFRFERQAEQSQEQKTA
jgi:putative transposase